MVIEDYHHVIKYKKYLTKGQLYVLNHKNCEYFLDKNNDIFDNQIEDCPICFESKESIIFKCNHFVCYKCYPKIEKCPLCRDEF